MAIPQQVSLFSFVMYSFGAKFEEHPSNISRDILDLVFCCFSGTIYYVITSLICTIQKCKNLSKTKQEAVLFT